MPSVSEVRRRRCRLCCVLACCCLVPVLRASEEDERFVAGLRQRRLFDLAEMFCQQRLAETSLPEADRVRLQVELIRAYAEHALNVSGDQREALWQQARMAAGAMLSNVSPQQGTLLRLQDALTLLARGELARREAEISPQGESVFAEARQALREAIIVLTSLDRELPGLIAERQRGGVRDGQLSPAELTALQHHVRRHLAQAYEQQALAYPAGSSDRTASLTAALEQLQQLVSQLPATDSLRQTATLQQARCLRLLGDTEAAAQYLGSVGATSAASQEPPEVRAERIRLLLARGEAKRALELIEASSFPRDGSPEAELAALETYIELWSKAAGSQEGAEAGRWREQALVAARRMEQTHGPYWGRRAELQLIRSGAARQDGSVEVLRRLADEAYRQGRLEDAVALYDAAAATARSQADEDQIFELAYKSALVQQQRMLYDEAAERFRTLAIEHSSHPHASNAHLLAIANVRQASAAAGTWGEEYVELLREHLMRWPREAKTASVAALWLGEWEAGRQQWQAAIAAFEQVAPDSDGFEAAVRALGDCWLRDLEARDAAAPSTAEKIRHAMAWLEQVVGASGAVPPRDWSPAQRQAAAALAALSVRYSPGRLPESERLLTVALAAEPPADPDWRVEAASLLVEIVARQPGRESDARTLLRQLEAAPAERLLRLFVQLGNPGSADANVQQQLARLRLEAVDLLQSRLAELSDADRVRILRGRAEALTRLGDREAAIKLYRQLARQLPQDGEIQEAYAQALLDGADAGSWQESLAQWRLIATRSPPRSARWFRAKYSVALAKCKLGQKADAAKLIRYLQVTEDLSTSGLEKEFSELLTRCQE